MKGHRSNISSWRRVVAALMLLLVSLPLVTSAQTEQRPVAELANDAYQAKDYSRAAELYMAASAESGGDAGSLYNAACSYALSGRRDEALDALAKAVDLGFDAASHMEADTDLASIREDARFAAILERARRSAEAHARFWNSPAIAVPYRESLSEDERIAGLSKMWSEAKFNFVHFAKVPELDWDAVYVEFLPKVRAAKTTAEYYRVLAAMYARLRDGHTGVWVPTELFDEMYAAPLVRTRRVEGQVLVVDVLSEELAREGIVPGVEILSIDGTPVDEYAASHVRPYESASTAQDLEERVYGRSLLRGSLSRPVVLELRGASGGTFTRRVARAPLAEMRRVGGRPPFELRMLPGNVAYVALNTFENEDAAARFDAAFSEIANAEALIIDVRANGGGNSGVGYRVLSSLITEPIVGSRWHTREYHPTFRAWGRREGRYSGDSGRIPPNAKQHFAKPVVVLTSAATYSAAEDFAVAFRAARRGLVVGEPTGGSTGQPLVFPLPGGGGARVCTKADTTADGTEFVGVGVMPDKLVRPTAADIRAGRDTVLEAARELLRASVPGTR